jgi:hypothetical protein
LQDEIARSGFISTRKVPASVRSHLADLLITNPTFQRIEITGVNHGGKKGGIKFSSVDLLGKRFLTEVYLVSDLDEFRRFM